MADYYPLLAKAVAGLSNSTPEARRAIYERARTALLGQLRRLEPPVPEADVERESQALEVAVARLEAELAPRQAETEPEQAGASDPVSDPVSKAEAAPTPAIPPPPAAPPTRAADAVPQAKTPILNSPARAMGRRVESASPPLSRPPLFFKVQREKTLGNAASSAARDPSSSPSPETLASQKPADSVVGDERSSQTSVSPQLRFQQSGDEEAGFASSEPREPLAENTAPKVGAGGLGARAPASAASRQVFTPAARTRQDAKHPFAPQPVREAATPKRLWIVGFVVGLLVLLVATAAYELRDHPEDLRHKAATPVIAPEATSNGKIVDRVGVAGGQSDATSASTPSEKMGANDHVAKNAPATEPPAVVSRRAALLVEAPEEQSKVKTYLGAVVWKVDNVSNGPGEPLSTAVRAEIDIPEEQLQAAMTFQKNFDSTLPASHTMKLLFTEPQGGPLGNVQQISVPQMRREDSATGDALTGVPVPITDNSFLVGLSRGSSEATNLDLIKSREWIDVPMLLSNGRIAKLTFEKGPTGQQALDDALAVWQTQ
jgi:hypothetical protein